MTQQEDETPMASRRPGSVARNSVYENGVIEGRRQARGEILNFLESQYMDRELERGSDRAEAILEIASSIVAAIPLEPQEKFTGGQQS